MNTSGSFSLKRPWKNTSGSDTYDEISTKRLKSDYVSGISQDYFNLSNPIIGPPNTELDGNEKPGQLRFKYYDEVQKGLLQVYDGSEWVSLNELEDSSLWHLSDNVVNIKNNYKLNLTNDLIVKEDLIVKNIRIPSEMTFYANTPGTNAIINFGYYDSQFGQYRTTASINLYSGLITAHIKPKSVLPNKFIKSDEDGELFIAPNSAFLSLVDQNLSQTGNVEFNFVTAHIKPKSVLPSEYIKTDAVGKLVAAPNSAYLSSINQNLSKTSDVEFGRLSISARLYIRSPNDDQPSMSFYSHNDDTYYHLIKEGNYWHRFRNGAFEDICDFRSSKDCHFYGYVSFHGGHGGDSSKRYKKNIQNIDYEILKEILNVDAKSYILKCNNSKNIGIIAEDIYDNCKNLRDYLLHYESVENLTKANNNKKVEVEEKYKFTQDNKEYVVNGIKYQNITVILLEIIKNQQQEINNLKEQLNIISNNVQELINTVNNLLQNQ